MNISKAMISAFFVVACAPAAFAQEPRPCEILLPEGADPRGTYNTNLWVDGVIPYEFDANTTPSNQAAMRLAMFDWENVAPVIFQPRNGDANYIHIQSSTGNNSHVGMIGGGQTINIFNWNYRFIMAHELGHALGLWHEQSRPDRDQYVQINYENICQTCCSGGPCDHNFNLRGEAEGPYDFDSVMHYGATAFSVNGQPTITVLPPYQAFQSAIGQRTHLSVQDGKTMAFLYGTLIDCDSVESLGDANCDGVIDTQDISAFALALVDPAGYATAYPACAPCRPDTNHDGTVDGRDIETFVEMLF